MYDLADHPLGIEMASFPTSAIHFHFCILAAHDKFVRQLNDGNCTGNQRLAIESSLAADQNRGHHHYYMTGHVSAHMSLWWAFTPSVAHWSHDARR